MPKETKPDRTPEEAEKLAREVMKRMLSTPPTPHEEMPKKRMTKKKSTARKSGSLLLRE